MVSKWTLLLYRYLNALSRPTIKYKKRSRWAGNVLRINAVRMNVIAKLRHLCQLFKGAHKKKQLEHSPKLLIYAFARIRLDSNPYTDVMRTGPDSSLAVSIVDGQACIRLLLAQW